MPLVLALIPASAAAKKGWYVRAPDDEAYAGWLHALTAAAASSR